MGKTYKSQPSYNDEDKQGHRKAKNSGHSNNKKLGGMKIINDFSYEDDGDYFDDEVHIEDKIVINKNSDNSL